MLRLKVKIERVDGRKSLETIAIANSGFIGLEPELVIPLSIVRSLAIDEIREPESHTKISGDGREIDMLKYRGCVNVYVVTEDRVVGPVLSSVLTSPRVRYSLLNDKLLGKLGIVLIDFGEGIWCFRDELGRKIRRTY